MAKGKHFIGYAIEDTMSKENKSTNSKKFKM